MTAEAVALDPEGCCQQPTIVAVGKAGRLLVLGNGFNHPEPVIKQ